VRRPRCPLPVRPYRGPGELLPGEESRPCGRPAGHNPPCRSREALASYQAKDRDRHAARRQRRGSDSGTWRKLTPAAVIEARALRAAEGTGWVTLADRYLVNEKTIRDAVTGVSWRQVPVPLPHTCVV
jgi:hypothetical protein